MKDDDLLNFLIGLVALVFFASLIVVIIKVTILIIAL